MGIFCLQSFLYTEKNKPYILVEEDIDCICRVRIEFGNTEKSLTIPLSTGCRIVAVVIHDIQHDDPYYYHEEYQLHSASSFFFFAGFLGSGGGYGLSIIPSRNSHAMPTATASDSSSHSYSRSPTNCVSAAATTSFSAS